MKVGILVTDLTSAGLFPVPEKAKAMHRNVLGYWKDIKRIGDEYAAYNPCDVTAANNRYTQNVHSNSTGCCFDKCFGDFGLVNVTRLLLQNALHADVYAHLQTVRGLVARPWVDLTNRARTISSFRTRCATEQSASP